MAVRLRASASVNRLAWAVTVVAAIAGCGRVRYATGDSAIDAGRSDANAGAGRPGRRRSRLSMREGPGCGRWSAPSLVPGSVNTLDGEANAWMREDGLVLVYTGTGTVGFTDILYATRPARDRDFATPTTISELSSTVVDGDPWMNDAMTVVVLSSTRTGNVELYQATRSP